MSSRWPRRSGSSGVWFWRLWPGCPGWSGVWHAILRVWGPWRGIRGGFIICWRRPIIRGSICLFFWTWRSLASCNAALFWHCRVCLWICSLWAMCSTPSSHTGLWGTWNSRQWKPTRPCYKEWPRRTAASTTGTKYQPSSRSSRTTSCRKMPRSRM